eukprot:GHVQ01043383.1.p1 GENE.GHVQ01043383.1~~GHVQ01043383.1.p1  ORF type:complete len:426 (+),score=85.05 GHVQ01043383.1:150-1280(+)
MSTLTSVHIPNMSKHSGKCRIPLLLSVWIISVGLCGSCLLMLGNVFASSALLQAEGSSYVQGSPDTSSLYHHDTMNRDGTGLTGSSVLIAQQSHGAAHVVKDRALLPVTLLKYSVFCPSVILSTVYGLRWLQHNVLKRLLGKDRLWIYLAVSALMAYIEQFFTPIPSSKLTQYKDAAIDFGANILGFFIFDVLVYRLLDPNTLDDLDVVKVEALHGFIKVPGRTVQGNDKKAECRVVGFHAICHESMTQDQCKSARTRAQVLLSKVDIAKNSQVTYEMPSPTDSAAHDHLLQMVIEKTNWQTANVFVYAGPVKEGVVEDGNIQSGVLTVQYESKPVPELSLDTRFRDPPQVRLQQYCHVRDTYRKYKQKLDEKKEG